MDLGGTLYRLRTEPNLSQGDRAEARGLTHKSGRQGDTGRRGPDRD